MAHDVFICYASPDKAIADAVCATLEASRIRCWVAPRDVLPGMGYAEALIESISESRMMLLVFSSSSNSSPQVLREVERATSKGIPILPFRIQDVPLSRSMEYFISTHHWLDALTPPLERHLQHLAETVKLLLARTAGPEDLGEELGAPRKAPAAEIAAEQGPETRAAEKRRLVLSSLGLVLARVGLRTRAAASGLGHLVERLRIAPRVLFAVTAGLGAAGIAAILLVLFVFVGQDSGGDSPSEATAQVAAVAPTPSPTPPPTPTPTALPSPAPTKEADEDGDTVPDASDNCPSTYNPDQANTYGDGRGDACEPAPPPPDGDNDTVPDASDNCPSTYNPDQANTYGDGRGDACEPTPTPAPTPASVCTTYASTDVPKEIYEFELMEYALWVPDGFTIDDVNVTLNITHTWAADLDVYLNAPTGTWVLLFAKVGFYGENFVNTVLDDEASTSITSGSAPLSGSYRPQEALSTFDGEPSFGWWVLGIVDALEGETGTLDSWSLELCGVPD